MKTDFCYIFIKGSGKKSTERGGGTWRVFSLNELQSATNNFNYDNRLGERGLGSVYWGQLWDGTQITVERLRMQNTIDEREFAEKVEIFGQFRHKNLLKLRGYCSEKGERLIVYNYMPNSTLFSHLHGHRASDNLLNWPNRMKIAIGCSEGLAYLHNQAASQIAHRNIKSGSILLDYDFTPKLADYSFAESLPYCSTHINNGHDRSVGYLAPEYLMWGKTSTCCDVYSFGILLLELVSGRKPSQISRFSFTRTIVDWALPLLLEGNFEELADPKLQEKYNEEDLKRIVPLAVKCARNAPEKRPTMLEVVDQLDELAKRSAQAYPISS